MTEYQEVRTTKHEEGREQRVATYKVTQLIWLLLALLEGALALRITFKLIGVNAANPFAALLYSVTDLFVAPFASLIGAPQADGMVLEISSLIAMIVYLLIAWAIAAIVNVLFYRPRGPVSVSQTIVADRAPQPTALGATTTTVTERTNTQTP